MWIANWLKKRWAVLLINREIQIKITMRYYLIINEKCWWGWVEKDIWYKNMNYFWKTYWKHYLQFSTLSWAQETLQKNNDRGKIWIIWRRAKKMSSSAHDTHELTVGMAACTGPVHNEPINSRSWMPEGLMWLCLSLVNGWLLMGFGRGWVIAFSCGHT